jgi:hypothetical protein
MDTIQHSKRHLTVNQIQNIQEHLEKLTSVAGNKWSMEILKTLYTKEGNDDVCEVVETSFEGNVYNFMKWLDDNTVKSQKVLLTSKMLVIGKSEHEITADQNPDKIDYLPLIDFNKFSIEQNYDMWTEVLDKEVVETITLKNTLTEI